MNVQTIDVSKMTPETIEALRTSLKQTGFAVLKNHGLDLDLLDMVYDRWAMYFDQPIEEKMKNVFNDKHEGYFPIKSENAKDYSIKDLKEFYHVYRGTQLPKMMTEHFGRGAQISPTHELMFNLEMLGMGILSLIGKDLHLHAYDSPGTLFRILHYPPVADSDVAAGAVRAAAHEDINLITLLPAATQPGLEVQDVIGNWYQVPCDPGTIIVNVGDMLQELSGGEYISTTHRVINPEGENVSRFSMPLFIHPFPHTRLSARYTAEEYLDERLKELGLK